MFDLDVDAGPEGSPASGRCHVPCILLLPSPKLGLNRRRGEDGGEGRSSTAIGFCRCRWPAGCRTTFIDTGTGDALCPHGEVIEMIGQGDHERCRIRWQDGN